MKKFIGLMLLMTSFTFADENTKIAYETLSYTEFKEQHHRYETEKVEYGQYHTILKLVGLPNNRLVELQYIRPLFNNTISTHSVFSNELYQISQKLEEEDPFIVTTGRGFLPGERVNLQLIVNGQEQDKVMSVVFNPIRSTSKKDGATISAQLYSLHPAGYMIGFENFVEGEPLVFESFSAGERISDKLDYTKNMQISHMPGIQGRKGGKCKIIITRKSGEQLMFSLPWGDDLNPYIEGKRFPI